MKREPVTSGREQDTWLHRLMRQPVKKGAVAPTSECLDADVLAAWADDALSAKALAAAEIHVANCSRCLTLLAAIERTAPTAAAPPHRQRLLIRWLVPLTVAATAVAIWVAIPQQQVIPVARENVSPRDTVSIPAPAPTPSTAAPAPATPTPVAPQLEARQEKALSPNAASARADAKSAPDLQAREEQRSFADSAAVAEQPLERDRAAAGQSQVNAREAPAAPQASADALKENIGATAERRALNKESIVEAVSPTEPLVRWRVLSGTDIERSTDGGKSWTSTSRPPVPIFGIRVVDALNATVTTSDGRSFSTTDGGAIWTPVQEKPAAPF